MTFLFAFFLVLHNNYQVFWHSLDSEGLRFRNMHFLHLSSLTHSLPSLRTLSRSSLSSHSFSVCFTSVLTWSWKRARSLGLCLFDLFLSLCVNFFFLHLNLNLTLLFILTCEHACKHMHIDFTFSLFMYFGTRIQSAPYALAKLYIICLLFPLTDPFIPSIPRSGNSLAHHNCVSQKWRMCF